MLTKSMCVPDLSWLVLIKRPYNGNHFDYDVQTLESILNQQAQFLKDVISYYNANWIILFIRIYISNHHHHNTVSNLTITESWRYPYRCHEYNSKREWGPCFCPSPSAYNQQDSSLGWCIYIEKQTKQENNNQTLSRKLHMITVYYRCSTRKL